MSVVVCPFCNRLVSIRFPMHDCRVILKKQALEEGETIQVSRIPGKKKRPIFLVEVINEDKRTPYRQRFLLRKDAFAVFDEIIDRRATKHNLVYASGSS